MCADVRRGGGGGVQRGVGGGTVGGEGEVQEISGAEG
jgi:hypothetical protein